MRTAIWWKGFWDQTLTGGETMVSVRLFGMKLDEMTAGLAFLEARIAEVEGERDTLKEKLKGAMKSALYWRDRAGPAEFKLSNAEKRLVEVVKILRRAKKQIRNCNCKDHSVHLCDDCESVVTGINLFIAEDHDAHAHEEEKHE